MPVDVAMVGGRSDPRNAILHQMFSHLGFGERAGSGLFMISSVWKNKNWIKPELKDELNPNRTILTLYMKKEKNYKYRDKCRDKCRDKRRDKFNTKKNFGFDNTKSRYYPRRNCSRIKAKY